MQALQRVKASSGPRRVASVRLKNVRDPVQCGEGKRTGERNMSNNGKLLRSVLIDLRGGPTSTTADVISTGNGVTPCEFFVSIDNGDRHGLLLGPYATHAEATKNVGRASYISKKDAWSATYRLGTVSTKIGEKKSIFGL